MLEKEGEVGRVHCLTNARDPRMMDTDGDMVEKRGVQVVWLMESRISR